MRKWTLLVALLLCWQAADALIVSVNGYGEISAEGMEITVDQATKDPMTGLQKMSIDGSLLTNNTLTVTIVRSAAGIEDEFCCADQCTAGNGEQAEELEFVSPGMASWYVHYTPAANSNETIRYTFNDGEAIRTLVVHFQYSTEAIDHITTQPQENAIYLLNGTRVSGEAQPNGIYIQQGQKMLNMTQH